MRERHCVFLGWLVCCAMALVVSSAVQGQASPDGNWVLPLGRRTLLVLSLRTTLHGGGLHCEGSIARPDHIQTKDFASFTQISGPTKAEAIESCAAQQDGTVRLIVRSPGEPNDRVTYLLRPIDFKHAEMRINGVPLPPMHLLRAGVEAKVSEDWEPGRTYTTEDDAASNPEMKRIFDEDQRVRQAWPKIDWDVVDKSDAERRVATRKLLEEGALHSGEDFCWAAFIFQHGSEPNDFLLAHTLSVIAVKKGYSAAIWMTTATLDRYLQSIKQPQVYGTQFSTPGVQPATQEPYNRTLISDALRRQLDVPSLAEQDTQRQKYDTDRHLPAKKQAP